jgi:hypothetical protein
MVKPRRPHAVYPSPKKKLDMPGRQSSTLRIPINELEPNSEKCTSEKWIITFELSSSKGAWLRLIAIDGVLFLVPKEAQRKRHRPPPDRASGLSSDTALYPHKYRKHTRKLIKPNKTRKINAMRPAGLKNERAPAAPKPRKIPVFDLLLLLVQCKSL